MLINTSFITPNSRFLNLFGSVWQNTDKLQGYAQALGIISILS
jgi:hypothetical protein